MIANEIKMIQTILFDLDGTLLNTLTDLANSVNFALTSNHLPQRSEQEVRRFLGNGIRNLIEQSVPEQITTDLLEKVFSSFKTHYLEHGLDFTAPYEGINTLLQSLKEKETKMAIISNKVDNAVQQLNARFFRNYIAVAVGEREGIKRKPAPDSVLDAMSQLHAQKDTTLYVGDSEVDYYTAQAAGIRCALVTWGFRDEAELRKLNADFYLQHPLDLLDLLSR